MKVLHICQRDDIATGGAVRVVVELLKRLPGQEIECQCLFVYGAPGGFGEELPGRCHYLHLEPGWRHAEGLLSLRRFLAQEQPDVIHHHDGLTWTHLVTMTWRHCLRIGHAHLGCPRRDARWRHRLAGWVQRRCYQRMIGVSKSVCDSWIERGVAERHMRLIPNGVDTDIFHPPSPDEKATAREKFGLPTTGSVICYVGRLHNEVKGTDDFVRILAALPGSFSGLVAGTGEDESRLRLLARELAVEARIRFVGLQRTTVRCYQASDVFVMTSRYEPFGLVVVEAAACGLPVIGFCAEGGGEELLRSLGAEVLETRDCGLAAARVAQTLAKPPGQLRKEDEARRDIIARLYSWEGVVADVAACYRGWTAEIKNS